MSVASPNSDRYVVRTVFHAVVNTAGIRCGETVPGWRATLDGAPARLLRADYAFMAAPVRAGRHVLDLVYFPDRLLPGIAVAILALALLMLLAQRVDTRSFGGYFPPP